LHEIFKIYQLNTFSCALKHRQADVHIRPAQQNSLYPLIFLVQSNKDARRLILHFYLVVPLWQHDFDRRLLDVLNAQEFAFDSNLVPILDTTHV
jgi:hypothetical protein